MLRATRLGSAPGGTGAAGRMTVLAVVAFALAAPAASAGTGGEAVRFRVLEGTFSQRIDGTGPNQYDICSLGGIATSATQTTTAKIGRQPDDQGGSIQFDASGAGSGQIGASGPGSATASWNGCKDIPPVACHGTESGEGQGSWSISIQTTAGDPDATLTWDVPPAALRGGSGTCLLVSIVAPRPFSFTTRQSIEDLLSGDPVVLRMSGQDSAPGGLGSSIGGSYTLSLTVQAIGVLSIRTTPAAGLAETGGRWPFSFTAAWSDEPCASPPAGSPSPLAYAVIGTDRDRLAALVGSPQEGLAARSGFKPNAFRLGPRANGRRIDRSSRSEGGGSFQTAADALHANNTRTMGPGNGVFYGARIACKKGPRAAYKVAKAAPRVLCRNRVRLSGHAWSGLTSTMQAKLEALYAILDEAQVCYALTSGYRSKEEQQKAYDDWHRVADRRNPADRTDRTLNQLCPNQATAGGPLAGFIQCPTSWDRNGVAQNGPGRPGFSRHEKGEAADLKLAFGALTGRFDPKDAERKRDVRARFAAYVLRVPGLCPSPDRDPGHIELPYSVTRQDAAGHEIVEPPSCHFSDGVQARSAAASRAARRPAPAARDAAATSRRGTSAARRRGTSAASRALALTTGSAGGSSSARGPTPTSTGPRAAAACHGGARRAGSS